jgi:CspA family cold shock protein
MSTRETGTVKWFNETKGYGFITRDNGGDVFVHFRGIRGEGYKTLNEGQRVNFFVTEETKGLRASDIVLIDDSMIKEVDDFEW